MPSFRSRAIRAATGLAGALLAVLPVVAPAAPPGKAPLDTAAAALARMTGAPVRPFSTRDFGRERYLGARSAIVPPKDAERLLGRVRAVIPAGTIAFVGVTNSLATPKPAGVELVVAPGKSQLDILRVAATDAVNYDLGTEDLLRELEAWDRELGIDIWQAETDTVQLRLRRLPADVGAFAARVYKFCPDAVDQGAGTVEALAAIIRKEKAIFLWWD